jgi:hypothetical protein
MLTQATCPINIRVIERHGALGFDDGDHASLKHDAWRSDCDEVRPRSVVAERVTVESHGQSND